MAMSWGCHRGTPTDADFFPADTGGLVVTIVTAHLLFSYLVFRIGMGLRSNSFIRGIQQKI